MVQTVYVDILIMTNFIVDYFLLMLTSFLLSAKVKRWRLFLSAFLASLTALVIFAPELNAFVEFIVKFLFSLLIVLIAFGYKNMKRYIKAAVLFFASNVIFAGGALLVWSLFAPRGLVVHNGAVFYNISPITLLLSVTAVYLVSLFVSKIISKRRASGGEYSVNLFFDGKSVSVQGIVDSGNMLKDSISLSPVIVCDIRKVRPLLNSELEKILCRQNFEIGFYSDIINSPYKNKFRVIPFESLSGSGVMAALVLDKAEIVKENKKSEVKNVVMAVTDKKIAGGEFDVLLNPELILV